jgi:uncharacterized membrane protein
MRHEHLPRHWAHLVNVGVSALFGATVLVIIFLGVSAGLSFLEFGAAFNAAVIAASFSTVGAIVASRRPKNPIG